MMSREPGGARSSTLRLRNVRVSGRRTSLRLERAMWEALEDIGRREHASINDLVSRVADHRGESSLTADVRVFALNYYRQMAEDCARQNGGKRRNGGAARR